MTMASIIKRCDCNEDDWDGCPHPWIVRYRTEGGRASRQREESFGDDLKEAGNFLLKVEHDKKAHVFIDPDAGKAVFRAEAEAWLAQRIGAESSDMTYKSVLRTHVYPAIGHRQIRTIRREEIKEIIVRMSRKGLSASRIASAHLVINAVFNEAVRNKKLAESPCTDIPVPDIVHAADFVLPTDAELEALAAGLPADWAATVWLMYGCGLRIGEALAVKTRSRINRGTTLRVREQVNPVAQVKPLKFRVEGQFRDIPLPLYVSEAIDKHIASHGTTEDGYLFRGRRHKHVTRRTYNEDFERAAGKAGLPPEFIPHTLRHCFASISLAHGIPITEVSRWLGHKSIEVTHQIYGHLVPSSWDRARTVLDDAHHAGRQQPLPPETPS
jgi:integrase